MPEEAGLDYGLCETCGLPAVGFHRDIVETEPVDLWRTFALVDDVLHRFCAEHMPPPPSLSYSN